MTGPRRSAAGPPPLRLDSCLAVAAAALVVSGCGQACQTSRIVEVEGAVLADAMGNIDVPAGGETVAILPDDAEIDIPAADPVVLAIDRRVPWGRVATVIDEIERRGSEPAILVSRRGEVRGFVLEDAHSGSPSIELLGFPSAEGWKSCVRPRGGDEAKCASQHQGGHIDASFTRELVREAVDAYRSRELIVGIPVTLPWGDAVRLIDGARTCCLDDDGPVRIEIVNLDERGAPLDDDRG